MPSTSRAQHNAMMAAAHGHSTLGIPRSVGQDFVSADTHKYAIGGNVNPMQPQQPMPPQQPMAGNLNPQQMQMMQQKMMEEKKKRQQMAKMKAMQMMQQAGQAGQGAPMGQPPQGAPMGQPPQQPMMAGGGHIPGGYTPTGGGYGGVNGRTYTPPTQPAPTGWAKYGMADGGMTDHAMFDPETAMFETPDEGFASGGALGHLRPDTDPTEHHARQEAHRRARRYAEEHGDESAYADELSDLTDPEGRDWGHLKRRAHSGVGRAHMAGGGRIPGGYTPTGGGYGGVNGRTYTPPTQPAPTGWAKYGMAGGGHIPGGYTPTGGGYGGVNGRTYTPPTQPAPTGWAKYGMAHGGSVPGTEDSDYMGGIHTGPSTHAKAPSYDPRTMGRMMAAMACGGMYDEMMKGVK